MLALRQDQSIIDNQQVTKIIIDRYLESKEGRTKDSYAKNLSMFFSWLDNRQIRPDILQRYKNDLVAKGLKTNTINTYLSPLRDFFSWCCEMEYLDNNPSKHLRRVRHKDTNEVSKARALTDSEVMQILGSTNINTLKDHSERVMLLCLFNLGLRIHEVLKLQIKDIDLVAGRIQIMGKGSKLRTLGTNTVLSKELVEYISKFGLRDDDYLIQTVRKGMNKKPGTIQHGNRVLKRIAERANIDMTGVKSHSGRVTAINHLLDHDVSLRDVANFAGHSNVNTTRSYDRKDTDKVVETCNIIDFSNKELL